MQLLYSLMPIRQTEASLFEFDSAALKQMKIMLFTSSESSANDLVMGY